MKNCFFLLSICGVWFIGACRPESNFQSALFDKAQSWVDVYPDSALFVLENSINKEILTESQHALWCLLITQARDKACVTITSDSLISIAQDYYEKNNKKDLLMEAFYYKGRIHQALNNVLRAQDYYLKALAAGMDSENYPELSRLSGQISALYLYQKDNQQALRYQKKALYYYKLNQDSTAISKVSQDIARAFMLEQKLDSASQYYTTALNYTDDSDKIHVLNQLGHISLTKQDHPSAYNFLQKCIALIPPDERDNYPSVYINMGATYLGMHQLDSATLYLQKSMQSADLVTEARANYYLYTHFKNQGDLERALPHLEKYSLLTDSVYSENRENYLRRLQSLHDSHQTGKQIIDLETANAYEANIRYTAWGIATTTILLLLVLVFVFIHLMKAFKKKRGELEWRLTKDHKDAKTKIEKNLSRIQDLEIFIKINRDKIASIKAENEKIKEQQEKQEEAIKKLNASAIYCKYHSATQSLREGGNVHFSAEDRAQLINSVEETYPDFANRIVQRYSKITKDELYLCYLHKIGIHSPAALSRFLHLSANSVISKRDRLYLKFFNKPGNMELFARYISSL